MPSIGSCACQNLPHIVGGHRARAVLARPRSVVRCPTKDAPAPARTGRGTATHPAGVAVSHMRPRQGTAPGTCRCADGGRDARGAQSARRRRGTCRRCRRRRGRRAAAAASREQRVERGDAPRVGRRHVEPLAHVAEAAFADPADARLQRLERRQQQVTPARACRGRRRSRCAHHAACHAARHPTRTPARRAARRPPRALRPWARRRRAECPSVRNPRARGLSGSTGRARRAPRTP